MSSRLLQNSRRSGAASSSAAKRSAAAAVELPPYEPPSCPLNGQARRALTELSLNRDTRKYDEHLKKSAILLRDSVGAINDVLYDRRRKVEQAEAKRRERGGEKSDHVKSQEAEVAQLAEDVAALTKLSETALRDVIDYQAELEDEKEVIAQVQRQAIEQSQHAAQRHAARRQQQRQRNQEGDGEAEEDAEMEDADAEEPAASTVDLLKSAREGKRNEYQSLSAHEKYGQNNDYISFKRTWHDALHPDDNVPLSDASRWFTADGRPVMTDRHKATAGPGASAAADEDEDEDEDLVVKSEVQSFKCPLTLQVFKEPYSSHVCKHTFEKSAIFDMMDRARGSVRCPQAGCDKMLSKKDLFLDEFMLRKIKRAQQQAERQDFDDPSDDNAGDEDASMVQTGSNNIKRERAAGRGKGRRMLDDVEDD